MKRALIVGITGQDGSYLAELLISKGYHVGGIVRRSSTIERERIDHLRLIEDADTAQRVQLFYGDLTDGSSLLRTLDQFKPDEVYNLGAQSHVRVSFDVPEYTADVNGLGTIRLLEAIRATNTDTRYYQASTSELFGNAGGPARRDDSLSAPEPVRRREGPRLFHDAKLPRGLRDVRGQRHPLQPRVAAPITSIRDTQGHESRS